MCGERLGEYSLKTKQRPLGVTQSFYPPSSTTGPLWTQVEMVLAVLSDIR